MKLFCIRKVVKAKPNEAAKYPTIHKEAVRKSPKGPVRTNLLWPLFRWTIRQAAGILIARSGHL
jgi:hypothetical protein